MKEVWSVDKSTKVLFPKDLTDIECYIGDSKRKSIESGVVTVPLRYGCIYINIPVSPLSAWRIIGDGGVDIYSDRGWSRLSSVDVMFKDTNEKVNVISKK